MASTLPINIPAPARIRSWKDLLSAAEELHSDSTGHGYCGGSRRRYCANVKVHSYGDLDKAIDKLGNIPDSAEEAIRADFSDESVNELFNEWLQDEGESLKEWFKGGHHSPPEYYAGLAATVRAGVDTPYPSLTALPTIPARLKEIQAWADESALFLEAFRAADDGDSITWEGRSGGYITWSPRYDIEASADDIIGYCEDALDPDIGPREPFRDALSQFREHERMHCLNLMLIDYLEAWAGSMDFQQELDYRVQNFYAETQDDYVEEATIFERHADLVVTFSDSLAAGNCQGGTAHWAAAHFPGRDTATVAEILSVEDSRPLARRACRKAIHRHLQAA